MKNKRISGCLSGIKLQPIQNTQASYISGTYHTADRCSLYTKKLKILFSIMHELVIIMGGKKRPENKMVSVLIVMYSYLEC